MEETGRHPGGFWELRDRVLDGHQRLSGLPVRGSNYRTTVGEVIRATNALLAAQEAHVSAHEHHVRMVAVRRLRIISGVITTTMFVIGAGVYAAGVDGLWFWIALPVFLAAVVIFLYSLLGAPGYRELPNHEGFAQSPNKLFE